MTNTFPKAWMTCVAFGVSSEVWMYRQATLLRKLDLTVIAKRFYNEERFPAVGFESKCVQHRWRLPRQEFLRQSAQQILGRLNRRVPGFAASPGETRWWFDQIERQRPQVVLAQFGNHAMEMLPLFQSQQIPVVAHFHGFDLSRLLRNRRYRQQLRSTAGQLAGYVVVAQYMRSELLQLGVPDNRIHVIPCGVPLSPMPSSEQRSGACRFLSVGRFVDKKRPELTVRAFASVADRESQSTLTMIGDGPMLTQCQELARTLGVAERIHFVGVKTAPEVKQAMMESSIFVQHSAIAADGDKEGWPVAIAEAAALALPVIATNHASIPEQIEHGKSGLLCDEGDWEAMSKNMLTLATSPELRQSMGRSAYDQMQPFSVDNQVSQLQNVLLNASAMPAANPVHEPR
ncbi:GDP-mannose-dependent alpha-(1-6)-phosphatidylinositol monomannoside mannosyltransferase [Rubripirellula lacrimiformis]|uniref:GDP-mannose-dependent alpha-(1-6)-phosphatidylinositol monomannoside mannosyltransferase n=1 Tax=Rubripirellula lacrimiformis TaxID=1930273 RepID=A0A517NFJ6_9BACT|nr:glycosyltransferase [Rubripirellula lacrimiformis]QDT05885.1 GDP-mannose-dependent alpha-(1-6)-phosphatidylinositol monomannoside mannosyltransferase [Rubripirellula lacrimiformis]